MSPGAITSSIDIAQVVLYLFWFFFAALIFYLRREDKREGYPLEDINATPGGMREGFPGLPAPKTFVLAHGGTRVAPAEAVPGSRQPINATATGTWEGAPIEPTGNPMLAGVGPGSWANRADEPDRTYEGLTKIVPLRVGIKYNVDHRDPDPRGKEVIGGDGKVGGIVTDVWVDRSEHIFRYLEVEVAGGRHVLLPINFSKINDRGVVQVRSIMAADFTNVPGLRNPDEITLLEEEKIMAYYGAGTLYADPSRLEPWL